MSQKISQKLNKKQLSGLLLFLILFVVSTLDTVPLFGLFIVFVSFIVIVRDGTLMIRKLLSGMLSFLILFVIGIVAFGPNPDFFTAAYGAFIVILGYGSLISMIAEYITKNRWYTIGIHVLGGMFFPIFLEIWLRGWDLNNLSRSPFLQYEFELICILPALAFGIIDQLVLRIQSYRAKKVTV